MNRRDFLKVSSLASSGLAALGPLALDAAETKADVSLRIAPVSWEIGPGKVIKTVGYNGSVPGPIVRFKEGTPVTVDVFNETDVAETVHWHGQQIPSAVDGSVEEGTPAVPPREPLAPRPFLFQQGKAEAASAPPGRPEQPWGVR